MNKASFCFAGLVTLLFSPPAFALTPPADWNVRNQTVVQTVPAQDIPSSVVPDDSINRLVNPKPNATENNPVDQHWIAPTPVSPGSADFRSAAPAAVPDRHFSQPGVSPAFAEASSAPVDSVAGDASRTVESAPPFGATPIQSQLGVEFGLSNSDHPLPVPVTPAQPVESDPPDPSGAAPVIQPSPAITNPVKTFGKPEFTLKDLFAGDSDSVVAVTVGNAEGTRQPSGQPNKAFFGHTDPGNGVWNLGTFSFQHGADSPEQADVKQLKRLKQQANVMQQKAADHGLKLTLEETLNGIDLANQAPQAVIDRQGYIEWLAKAYAQGLKGTEAILWARVHSFIDPETQQWNAPGLGNTRERITRDQQRRMEAIASAIDAQDYAITPDARLRVQPVVFRIPGLLGVVRQAASEAAQWFGF